VISEEIARDPEVLVRDAKLNSQELGEMPNDCWIGVCESNRVSSLVPLSPIELAPVHVKVVRVHRSSSTLLLEDETTCSTTLGVYFGALELPVVDRVAALQ